ncbi:MAG: PaaI family thioesterase [Propionibacteriaceae bacterium]|nr:PaaI family thioesterase [Propionibacteriaceae bacterium]
MSDFLDTIGVGRDTFAQPEGPAALGITAEHLNPNGGVHGGVIATLVDTAMGVAARDGLGDGRHVATVSLTINYLNPAVVGDVLLVTPEVSRIGRRLIFTGAEVVRSSDQVIIAQAIGSFAIIP